VWYAADSDVVCLEIRGEDERVKLDERAEWRKLQAAKQADRASGDSDSTTSPGKPPGRAPRIQGSSSRHLPPFVSNFGAATIAP
jgi:hypothetical protein